MAKLVVEFAMNASGMELTTTLPRPYGFFIEAPEDSPTC